MEFNDSTIKTVVEDINEKYHIPIFQRQITWDEHQMLDFYDSLMKDYYIGELLFWTPIYDEKNKNVPCYKFIRNYVPSSKAPTESLGGVNRNELTDVEVQDNELTLVLDGQQRMNTLYIGLRGSLWKREKGEEYAKEDSWNESSLYLNLINNPDEGSYEFSFLDSPNDDENLWYEVSRILEVDNLDKEINKFKNKGASKSIGLDSNEIWNIEDNIEQLYDTFVREKNISFYSLGQELASDEAHKIFVRTNQSGTQLSSTDLLITHMTPVWQEKNGQITREEFIKLMDIVNNKLDNRRFDLKDLVKLFMICNNDSGWLQAKSNEDYTELSDSWKNEVFQESIKKWCDIMISNEVNTKKYSQRSVWPTIYYTYKAKSNSVSINDEFENNIVYLSNILSFTSAKRDTIINLFSKVNDYSTVRYGQIEKEMEGKPYSLLLDEDVYIEKFTQLTYSHRNARTVRSILSDNSSKSNYIIDTDGKDRESVYYSLANMYFDEDEARPLIQGSHLYDDNELLRKNAERLINKINDITRERIKSSG